MVFDALDRGGGLLMVPVGCADVLDRGQVVGEDGEQGVGGVAAIGGGDEEQFGVGGGSGFGEPAHLSGAEVVGVVDDDEAAQR